MKYQRIVSGRFLERPNRFVAIVEINGVSQVCHVKNTGRCRELLVPGAVVYLEQATNPARKTQYDLVSVEKNGRLINMDSQAPNQAAGEWLLQGGIYKEPRLVKPECQYQSSRFDFYLEAPGHQAFVEVKGVTLEEENVVSFPDAPTQRGIKHLQELCRCMEDGFEAYLLFVIQMKDVDYFTPNDRTHPQFGEALRQAQKQGVRLLAYDCRVTPEEMTLCDPVDIRL